MRVNHGTSAEAARAILAVGFSARDEVWCEARGKLVIGVELAVPPLDRASLGPEAEVLLVLDVPEDVLERSQWLLADPRLPPPGGIVPGREVVVPAEMPNRYGRPEVDEEDDL